MGVVRNISTGLYELTTVVSEVEWIGDGLVFRKVTKQELVEIDQQGIHTITATATVEVAKQLKRTPKGYALRKGIPRKDKKEKCSECGGTGKKVVECTLPKTTHGCEEASRGQEGRKVGGFDGVNEMMEQARRRWNSDRIKTRADWKRMVRVQREKVKLAELMMLEPDWADDDSEKRGNAGTDVVIGRESSDTIALGGVEMITESSAADWSSMDWVTEFGDLTSSTWTAEEMVSSGLIEPSLLALDSALIGM
jgi:hypothetical protein